MMRYAISALYLILALASARSAYHAIQVDQFILAALFLTVGAFAWVLGLARLTGVRL